jgi:BirA family biotin operon repressor/biotin-[acetyl-CoA-carboxylase] ligase
MKPLDLHIQLPQGHDVRAFEVLGSTSDQAKLIAENEGSGFADFDYLWIWAQQQTKGRGRRGREWISRKGNLTTTLLMYPEFDAVKGSQLSFVSALALADLFATFVDESRVKLKWPNDCLIGDAKAAGILLESSALSGAKLDWLSIGFGVNLAFHPEDTPYPATSLVLHRNGPPIEPLEALTVLTQKFDFWVKLWCSQGFPVIREAWLSRAKGLGEPIIARLAQTSVEGTFEDLDEEGGLIIRLPSGDKKLISAGEVYFPE